MKPKFLTEAEFDRDALALTFACRCPEKMKWERTPGLYQCHGCSGRCGTTYRAAFHPVIEIPAPAQAEMNLDGLEAVGDSCNSSLQT